MSRAHLVAIAGLASLVVLVSFATSHADLGVFDVAAEVGVPVLLHTGFSPFPGTRSERDYYDPARLASVVEAYDGTRGAGRVDFVLSHVGQGTRARSPPRWISQSVSTTCGSR